MDGGGYYRSCHRKILVNQLRNQYTQNPLQGMTSDDIKYMNDNDLLDMNYFLHENVFGEL